MTSGVRAAAARKNRAMASKSRKRACAELSDGSAGSPGNRCRSSGTSAATETAAGPSSSASADGSRSMSNGRSTSIHGQYAGAPPASQQRPHITRALSPTRAHSSSASLVLPMPGSPTSRNNRPRPSRASPSAASRAASSASRPRSSMEGVCVGRARVVTCDAQAASSWCADSVFVMSAPVSNAPNRPEAPSQKPVSAGARWGLR